MSRSNRGVVIVVGGGVVLGAVFAIVYATVIDPSAKQTKAQKEIAAWGEAWAHGRACLVGNEPRSTDATEAYVSRELLDDSAVVGVRECLEPLKRLRRKPGDSSGEKKVELAWSDLKKSIGLLGTAHALRAAKEEQAVASVLRSKLGDGISAVDTAYSNLRAAAAMDAAPVPGGGRLKSAAVPKWLAARVTHDSIRANVVVIVGELEGDPPTEYLARIDSVDPPPEAFRPRQPLAVTTDRGPIWGVWLDPGDGDKTGDGLSAGPLDERGAPSGPGVRVVSVAPGAGISAMYATADGDRRLVVYRVQSDELGAQIRVARSIDRGVTWSDDVSFPAGAHLVRSESLARADVTWVENRRVKWLPIDAGWVESFEPTDLAPELLLGYSQSMRPCFGKSAAWWILGDAVVYVGADGRASPVPGMTETKGIVLCDDDHLVEMHAVADGATRTLQLTRCRPTSCDRSMELPMARDALALATLGPKLGTSVTVSTNGVVSVWSGDTAAGDPLAHSGLFALPASVEPFGLVEWDGRLHIISDRGGVVSATALPSE